MVRFGEKDGAMLRLFILRLISFLLPKTKSETTIMYYNHCSGSSTESLL